MSDPNGREPLGQQRRHSPAGRDGKRTPIFLVLNRFEDEFGEYHRFLDDGQGRLAYITTAGGLSVLHRETATAVEVVPDTRLDTVLPVARRLSSQLGGFAGIAGLSEYDLLTAASLRRQLGVPGYSPEFVRNFRDKLPMKRAISRAGLRVPRFCALAPGATPDEVLATLSLPLIIKPRAAAASAGVRRIDSAAELGDALAGIDPAEYECEEFISGPVFHVDGVRRGGGFHFVSVSGYVNTCLDFAGGMPLGSALLDPGPFRGRMITFAGACLDALSLRDGPFHLELFQAPDGGLVFLEVGLRPGGAEVPFLHRDLFGVDLMAEAFRATLALPPMSDPQPAPRSPSGGWLIFPEPEPLPSRVVSATSMVGVVPGVYAERVPAPGDLFDGTGGYDHVGGSFRLRGRDEAAVRHAISAVIARYQPRALAGQPTPVSA